MNDKKSKGAHMHRREFFAKVSRGVLGTALAGTVGVALAKASGERLLWQIDPLKCIQCGQCRTECVLEDSAVKCVHDFTMCGYCDLCTGFFYPDPNELAEGAENQLCPTGAIVRRFVEEPYFEYRIDESRCTGCGICVKGCTSYGNGSLYLQVRHNRCLNCNECAIATRCPSEAFLRLPASEPYLVKHEWMARQKRQRIDRFPPPGFESGYTPPGFLDSSRGGDE